MSSFHRTLFDFNEPAPPSNGFGTARQHQLGLGGRRSGSAPQRTKG